MGQCWGAGLKFADPGKERQDSVFNGLKTIPDNASLVCVHDAARPLVSHEEIYNVIRDADEHGAAVLAVPMKATVKESADGKFVLQTIDRSRLWEIHTPQVRGGDGDRKKYKITGNVTCDRVRARHGDGV